MTLPFSRFAPTFAVLTLTLTLTSLPLACGSSSGLPDDSISRTRRPVGAPCAEGWQCAYGACSADSVNGGCGVCQELLRLGESCEGPLVACSATAVCTAGLCQSTKKTAGEPCTIEAKGGSNDCDVDFFCAGASGGAGVCTAKPDLGEACDSSYSGCAGRGDCERGVCVAPALGALGESCENRPCEAQLVCHSRPGGLTCVEPSPIPVNGPCGVHGPGIDCVKGAACELTGEPEGPDGYPMACLAGKAEGEECASSHCAEGLVCEEPEGETTFRCQRLRTEGEPCRSFQECGPGLECREGQCSAECR